MQNAGATDFAKFFAGIKFSFKQLALGIFVYCVIFDYKREISN